MPTGIVPARKKTSRRKSSQKRGFDQKKEVRAIARERVGTVKASRVIVPKAERKAKYKTPLDEEGPER